MRALDIEGHRFGRLVALRLGTHRGKERRWVCACDCGAEAQVTVGSLRSGNTGSCGCLHREQLGDRFRKHGQRRSPEYGIWCEMRKRCENPRATAFYKYGARGIKVCARWRASFAAFREDMGPRPSRAHSIDRYPNKSGNYEPGNCRWATPIEQARNTRRNVVVRHDGLELCLTEWVERLGLKYGTVHNRIQRGWSPERALGLT